MTTQLVSAKRGSRRLPGAGILALWITPIVFLGLFYFYPLISIFVTSFARSPGGLIAPFIQALGSPTQQNILWFTFWQAALSTFLTLLIGLPGAYLLARYEFRGKSLLRALTGIPFVLPTLVVAAAFNALLGPQGLVNLSLMSLFNLDQPPVQFTNTLTAILVAHVFYNTTIVLRMVGDYWSHLDPRMTQAAEVLGANRWRVLRHVILPLLMPAIISAALLVFLFCFTSFGVILVLGGPRFATLEVEIYYQTVSLFNLPLAAALSIIQLFCTLAMTIIYTRLVARVTQPISLKPARYTQKKMNTWRSKLLGGMIIIALLVFMVTPLVALAVRSVTRFERSATPTARSGYGQPSWGGLTLDYYRELSNDQRGSLFYAPPGTTIAVSLGYASATMALALLLGIPAAWALARNGAATFNRLLDPILMLPLGTSAVTLGLGFIIALDQPPLDLRASPILIPLAHTLVAFPFVIRSLTPALRSIRPNLRQAALVMGASPRQVFRHVDLPLVGRAVFVAAAFAFTISMGEFGATALIARPEYPTIPLAIYRLIGRPGALNYGQAMALSTILMLVTASGMLAIERLRIADVGEF